MRASTKPKSPSIIFHGVSLRNFSIDPASLKFDKLFFPSRYMMEQYIERGILAGYDPARLASETAKL